MDKASRVLIDTWNKNFEPEDEHDEPIFHTIHFAHSQGAIFTAPALWRYTIWHPVRKAKRLHVIVFGSGYHFLDWNILPKDHHFVVGDEDFVNMTAGARFWNPQKLWDVGNSSKLVNYPKVDETDGINVISSDGSAHSFFAKDLKPNTYGWWTHYVGGPIFRNTIGYGNSIHGERAELAKRRLLWRADLAGVEKTVPPPGYTTPPGVTPVPDSWIKVEATFNSSNRLDINPREVGNYGP